MVTIRTDNLTIRLNRRTVLEQVDIVFEPGQLIGVIGPNGAGKSTLVRAMLGLLPYAGRIAIDGTEATSLSRSALARKIAYLPQGQTLHWPLTVERLVGLGRLPHLAPMSRVSDADQVAIAHAMKTADVLGLRDRIATELSGGERARVLLARALAVEAPALIADEPLAALDPRHQIEVMELLRNEARAGGLVVAVLHDLTMAARYCDRLLLLDAGRVAAEGAPLEVLSPERLAAVYGIAARIDRDELQPLIVPLQRSD
jgi:iron complex transport system ATP-binding protein